MTNPIATVTTRRYGAVTLELYPDHAPESVRNFIDLVRSGFFTGKTFWRVEKDLLVQTGSATNGVSFEDRAGYAILGEFKENGVENPLRFEAGTLGYGRLTPNSANTHVFITVAATPALDDKYAAFGRVTSGLDAIAAISRGPSEPMGVVHRALDPEMIERIEVETFGVDYPLPERLAEPSTEELQAAFQEAAASAGGDEASKT